MMTEMIQDVTDLGRTIDKTLSKPGEAERAAIREMVKSATDRGLALTGPDGLLKIMTTDLGPDLDHHHRLHPPTPSRGPLLLPTGHHLHRPRIDPQQTSHYPATEHAVTT